MKKRSGGAATRHTSDSRRPPLVFKVPPHVAAQFMRASDYFVIVFVVIVFVVLDDVQLDWVEPDNLKLRPAILAREGVALVGVSVHVNVGFAFRA